MSRARTRGFVLVEMMFVIGLLSVVALIVGQLYFASVQTTQRVAAMQTAQTRFDQAVRRLRGDVWGALGCTSPDPHTLRIERPDGKAVEWSAGQFLRRTSGEARQSWEELRTDLRFEVRGPVVVVVQDPAEGEAGGGRVALLNEAALLKGGRP